MSRPSRSWDSQFAFRIFVYASAVVAARKALEKATRSKTAKSIPGRGTPSRRSLPLLHGRDRELGIFLPARRPARSDRLGQRVDAEAVCAVLLKVSEARAISPATEVKGAWHRD